MADSIADHSAYLLGAKNGKRLRYAGLKGCTDCRRAAEIIRSGGYATSLSYVDKLCRVTDRWDLTRFDEKDGFTPYLVRVSIPDLNIRTGPGTDYPATGYIPLGVFTIVEESADGKWGG